MKTPVRVAALILSAVVTSCGGGGVNTVPIAGPRLGSPSSACDVHRRAAPASGAQRRGADALSSAVNDPLADDSDQWYLYKANVPAAWAVTHGSPAVAIAMIGTGIELSVPTPDFVVSFQESVVNGVTSTAAGAAQDTNGRGTLAAGLAAALANNAYGFAGVGYNTALQSYRIFPAATSTSDSQSSDTGDEAQAIRDAVNHGAAVIDLDFFGSPQSSGADEVEQSAINFALSNNVVVVAGNGDEFGAGCGNESDFPAAYPGVIAVGASAVVDDNSSPGTYGRITSETVASYSNSGPALVAPGGDPMGAADTDLLHWVEGYSTTKAAFPPDQCTNAGGVCRGLFSGSPSAAAQVAGAVALIIAAHGGSRMSPASVRSILTQSADVLPGIAATRQGAGRLNVGSALAIP